MDTAYSSKTNLSSKILGFVKLGGALQDDAWTELIYHSLTGILEAGSDGFSRHGCGSHATHIPAAMGAT